VLERALAHRGSKRPMAADTAWQRPSGQLAASAAGPSHASSLWTVSQDVHTAKQALRRCSANVHTKKVLLVFRSYSEGEVIPRAQQHCRNGELQPPRAAAADNPCFEGAGHRAP